MPNPRLLEHNGELIDRSREIAFSWQGEPYTGYAGDTVASALYAAGVRVFSRSFKYHRPRGLLCCSGQCPNCLVEVDGVPTVRACMTPIGAGCRCSTSTPGPRWSETRCTLDQGHPGLRHAGRLLLQDLHPATVGVEVLREVSPHRRRPGQARPRASPHPPVREGASARGRTGDRRRPAGLEAAIAAAGEGRDVALVDEGLALGGHLAYSGHKAATAAQELADRARDLGVHILQPAYAGGMYEGNLVPVYQGDTMHRFRAEQVVLASGTLEQPLVFAGNDRPGVMLGSAARRLVNQFRIPPGEQAVVVCADDAGIEAALDLAHAGMVVSAVADTREGARDERLAQAGIEHLTGFAPVRTKGRKSVTGVEVARGSERRSLSGDVVLMSGGQVGQLGFLTQAGGSYPLRPREAGVRARPRPRWRARGGRAGAARARPSRPSAQTPRASSSCVTARTSPPRTCTSQSRKVSRRWSSASATPPSPWAPVRDACATATRAC